MKPKSGGHTHTQTGKERKQGGVGRREEGGVREHIQNFLDYKLNVIHPEIKMLLIWENKKKDMDVLVHKAAICNFLLNIHGMYEFLNFKLHTASVYTFSGISTCRCDVLQIG